jgi:hypothetical protein
MQGFESPEDAAMVGFPAKYCRVVATRTEGDCAYVLIDTGSQEQPYLYGVNCARLGGRWFEGSSGNGWGWSLVEGGSGLGTISFWTDAPAGADIVRIEFDGQVFEELVVNGAFLFARFRQPSTVPFPYAIAFRVDG